MAITSAQLTPLIDRHWGPLVAWVGPRDEAAEDIVQRTFIALAGLAEMPENVVAWLYATSRHLAINERVQRQRRMRREQSVAKPEQHTTNPWRTLEASELVEKLGRLADEDRQIIVAHLWGCLSLDEVAGLMHRSRASIYRDYRGAIQRLKNLYHTESKVLS